MDIFGPEKNANRGQRRLSTSPNDFNAAAEENPNPNLEVEDEGAPWKVAGQQKSQRQSKKSEGPKRAKKDKGHMESSGMGQSRYAILEDIGPDEEWNKKVATLKKRIQDIPGSGKKSNRPRAHSKKELVCKQGDAFRLVC